MVKKACCKWYKCAPNTYKVNYFIYLFIYIFIAKPDAGFKT
jgi:hypothetical protein